jgi:hypothetical protein
MKGLIQAQQSPEGRDDITPETVKEGIQIPDEFKEAYERLVAAGMTIMFSEKTNKSAVQMMKSGEGTTAQRLGQAIAALLGMLVKESNGTFPPQVLIPAGVELLAQAADFLRKSGLEAINNQVIGDAMDVMITTVLQAGKLDVQKIAGFIEQNQAGAGGAMLQQPPMMGA